MNEAVFVSVEGILIRTDRVDAVQSDGFEGSIIHLSNGGHVTVNGVSPGMVLVMLRLIGARTRRGEHR